MRYYLDLFSPETYEAFSKSDRTISGFRQSQESYAKRIKIGDKLVCYMTKLSRFVGVLEVQSKYFIDDEPIFYPKQDPFTVRFKVKPLAWLPKETAIPIKDKRIWDNLSFTKGLEHNSTHWTGKVRNSLNQLDDQDGNILEKFIFEQLNNGEEFEINEREYEKLITHKVH
ncbi:MAG: EVE domain-containing protein, partial [Ignavibacteriaceae bacterium]